MSSSSLSVSLPTWVAAHRNKLLHGGQLKVMVVGGPNDRLDYHIEDGEELFLQLEGAMNLLVVERGVARSVRIGEGEVFLLPRRIPHSPQRLAATVGLVVERERVAGEVDAMRWYTPDGTCRVLYEETFECTDLGSQLKPVIARFKASPEAATGEPREGSGTSGVEIDTHTQLPPARCLREWVVAAIAAAGGTRTSHVLYGAGAAAPFDTFASSVTAHCGRDIEWETPHWVGGGGGGEVFLYQLEGSSSVCTRAVGGGGGEEGEAVELYAGDTLLIPAGREMQARWGAGGGSNLCLRISMPPPPPPP